MYYRNLATENKTYEAKQKLLFVISRHLSSFPSWLKIIDTIRTSSKQAAGSLPFHHIRLVDYPSAPLPSNMYRITRC